MGAASCKNAKTPVQDPKAVDTKKITIGVFGLDNAGKTSIVKAIEGAPTKNATATMSSNTSMVPYPTGPKDKQKSQERIKIIDVSGNKKFRERAWSEYYDQIHGLVFVLDASEKKRITENKDTLDELLTNNKLRDKPILILANKQDCRGAIKTEDHIKDKLDIEELKTKHKIELCTAIPNDKNKADDSIRQGFSWLIREIENDYAKLNGRVNNTRSSLPPKPAERRTRSNARSDQSDMDDDIVYAGNRPKSSSLNRKPPDYRSLNIPSRLPNLDLNKPKGKSSGYQTHSEHDDDDDAIDDRKSRPYSRPNIPISELDRNDRDRSSNQLTLAATSGFNKKKKVIGAGAGTGPGKSSLLTKNPSDSDPKSFRSAYEPFPEEKPWSSSATKTTKYDDSMLSKPHMRSSMANDLTKRSMSPLAHDTKPYTSGSLSKRGKGSDDDDDDILQREKSKSLYPAINRSKDSEYQKYPPPLSTNKPSSNLKKSTSDMYGIDEDDDDLKLSNTLRRSNFSSPGITAASKKPYQHDDDSDHENNYKKTTTSKTTKNMYSDDEDRSNDKNKTYPRSLDRSKPGNDLYGTSSKALPSSTITGARSKNNTYDLPSSSKPTNQSKSSTDNYLSKPSQPKGRYGSDDDDDLYRSPSAPKLGTKYKYDDDDDYKVTPKSTVRPKYDDDDDLPSSSAKFGTREKYDHDYPTSSLSKQTARLTTDDNGRPSSPLRLTPQSKYGDDNRSSSPMKLNSRSKLDDDDFPSSLPKTVARPKYGTEDRFSSSVKPNSGTRFNGDDDRPSLSSKIPSRLKLDDDDDDRPSYASKAPSRPKYDDDDDDRPLPLSKAPTQSRFVDDDYLSSSKKNNYSSHTDDYSSGGGARSRFGNNDLDSSRGASNSARIGSAAANRPRINTNFDS